MAKKKIYFGTNTKMYKTIKDTVEFVSQLQELTKDISREDMQLFVIPSYTTLRDANEAKDEDLDGWSAEHGLGGTGTVHRRDFSTDASGSRNGYRNDWTF